MPARILNVLYTYHILLSLSLSLSLSIYIYIYIHIVAPNLFISGFPNNPMGMTPNTN